MKLRPATFGLLAALSAPVFAADQLAVTVTHDLTITRSSVIAR